MATDRLTEIFERQAAFTSNFHDATPSGIDECEELTKNYTIMLIKELTEVVDELNYKLHASKRNAINVVNVHEELMDVQKFLIVMMQLWDIDADKFVELFHTKSTIVEQRYKDKQR